MRILLVRYSGVYCAKSILQVWSDDADTPALVCEAREAKYKDYSEKFPNCSNYCLPTGVYPVKVRATKYSPMTLVVQKAAGHKGCAIGYDTVKQYTFGDVLIGRGKDADNPLLCRLTDQKAVFDNLQKLVQKTYLKIWLINHKFILLCTCSTYNYFLALWQ